MTPSVERLGEYLLDKFEARLDFYDRLSLFFTVTGEKPGALIQFLDPERGKELENFCDEFGLEYRSFETELHTKYYVTRNEELFQYLEKVDEDEPFHNKESEGDFLGYPRNAINFFVENSGKRDLDRRMNEKIDEMLESGKLDEEDLHLLDLVMFIPELTDQGIRQAVEIGEKRREQMRQFDRTHESDLGEKLLDEVFNRSEPYFRS
ncbi:MAG: hypothetical protein ABEJ36_00490 [Candidatus Nanosalina sp.]